MSNNSRRPLRRSKASAAGLTIEPAVINHFSHMSDHLLFDTAPVVETSSGASFDFSTTAPGSQARADQITAAFREMRD